MSIVTIFEMVFPILVQAFHLRMTHYMGGPISSTVKEVEICSDRIFDVALVELKVYESKI